MARVEVQGAMYSLPCPPAPATHLSTATHQLHHRSSPTPKSQNTGLFHSSSPLVFLPLPGTRATPRPGLGRKKKQRPSDLFKNQFLKYPKKPLEKHPWQGCGFKVQSTPTPLAPSPPFNIILTHHTPTNSHRNKVSNR